MVSKGDRCLCDDDVLTTPLAKETVGPAPSAKGKNEEGEASKPTEDFSLRKLPCHQKWTLFLLGMAELWSSACFSLLAPFFPSEAVAKGMTPLIVGLIFSSFEFWIFVSSPIFGIFIRRIGCRFLCVTGLLVAGVSSVSFGFLDKCPPGEVFIVLCFIVRSFMALGASAFFTSGFAIGANLLPKHVSTVFAFLETFSGVGYLIGPLFGGVLYEVQGFGLPFWFMGGLLSVWSLLIAHFLPYCPGAAPVKRDKSVLYLVKNPLILVCCVSVLFANYAFGSLDSTLELHLNQFRLSKLVVGLLFSAGAALFVISTPFWIWLVNKKKAVYQVLIGGNISSGIAFLLIGPSPVFPFLKPELWLVVSSFMLTELLLPASITPTLNLIMMQARKDNIENDLDLSGMVSGLFNFVIHLGTFLGPTGSSLVFQLHGFNWSSTLTAGFSFFSALCFVVYLLVTRVCLRQKDFDATENTIYIEVQSS